MKHPWLVYFMLAAGFLPAVSAGSDVVVRTDNAAIKSLLVSAMVMGEVALVDDTSTVSLTDGTVVSTDQQTQLTEISALPELNSGDLVQAEGQWSADGALHASWLRLVQRSATQVTREGTIAVVTPPDQIRLEDGLVIRVHSQTTYVGVADLASLTTGDRIQVVGVQTANGSIAAASLLLLEAAGPIATAFESTVATVRSVSRVVDSTGTEITVNHTTVLVGLTGLFDLEPGNRLWVEGFRARTTSSVTATRLTLIGVQEDRLELVTAVTALGQPDRFFTADHRTVIVGPATRWLGVEGIAGLRIDDTVRVVGSVASESITVHAEEVLRVDGEDAAGDSGANGGAGLVVHATSPVSLIAPPDLFVLYNGRTFRTTATTSWLGDLQSLDDLVPGMVVRVAATMGLAGALVADSVGNVGHKGAQVRVVAGQVVMISGDGRLHLDTGTTLEVTEDTVVDGDVDDISEIVAGMTVSGSAVEVSEAAFLALSIVVEGMAASEPSFPDYAGGGYVVDEALVVLVASADATEVANRHGAEIVGSLPGLLVHLFRWSHPVTEEDIIALVADPDTEEIEANYRFEDLESIRRSMPVIDRAATSERYNAQNATVSVGLELAHARSHGAGALVAVLDTGVDPFHPVLRHRIADGGLDFVGDDAEPWEEADGIDQDGDGDVDEAAGHGTFVSGLVVLVAPSASILPYRVLDDEGHGTAFAICRAVLAAVDRGVDVVSMSFAYHQRSRVLDRILDEASRRGVVLVSGAGNESTDILPFPARDHRVLAIGAVNDDDQVASFSNWGEDVVIGAPGVEVYCGLAEGQFGTWSGTSMAAPLVSGTAALLRSVNPYLTPEDIAAALLQGARTPPVGEPVEGLLDVAGALALVPDAP